MTAVPASAVAAQAGAGRDTVTFAMEGDQVFPEGVAVDRRTGTFYVGSTTDGTIQRGRLGSPVMTEFLAGGTDGRTTAIGMTVDRRGRLFVSGGGTGQMWVYDTRTGDLVRRFDTGLRANTFINDVALDADGNAYFTDSLTPTLWRVPRAALRPGPAAPAEAFLDFTGTPLAYQAGFNLNGIIPAAGGHRLIVVQSNTGKLGRIDIATRRVAEITVAGGPLTAGDGLARLGGLVLVVRNQLGVVATVAVDGLHGRVVNTYTDPTFAFPTTAKVLRGRLLVVNSQFNRRGPGLTPELPFTVSGVPIERVVP